MKEKRAKPAIKAIITVYYSQQAKPACNHTSSLPPEDYAAVSPPPHAQDTELREFAKRSKHLTECLDSRTHHLIAIAPGYPPKKLGNLSRRFPGI